MTNDPSISAGQITGYFRVAISHGSANFYIWVKKGVSTKKCPLSPKPNLQWIVLYNTVSCTVVSPFTVCLIKTTHKHWIITQLNPFPLLSPEQLSICAHCCEHCGLGIQCKDKQLKQKDQETKRQCYPPKWKICHEHMFLHCICTVKSKWTVAPPHSSFLHKIHLKLSPFTLAVTECP